MSPQPTPPLTLCELADPGLDTVPSYSPFCTKAIWALRRAGLPYTSRRGAHPGVFKGLSPTGQVPVLLVGDTPVTDSTAILARIEELSDRPMSAALSPAEQAEARLWEDYADTGLSGFLVAARWADDRNWPRTKAAYFADVPRLLAGVVARKARAGVVAALVARDVWRAGPEACWSRLEQVLDDLDVRAPSEGFWVARTPSVADIGLGAMLGGLQTPLTPAQAESVGRRARLAAYLDRVRAAMEPTARSAPDLPEP